MPAAPKLSIILFTSYSIPNVIEESPTSGQEQRTKTDIIVLNDKKDPPMRDKNQKKLQTTPRYNRNWNPTDQLKIKPSTRTLPTLADIRMT